MKYTLAIFKSRFATLNFANQLKVNHVPCAIINTPHSAGNTCGISVKFLTEFLPIAKQLMINPRNFDGFYSLVEVNGYTKLVRI